MEQRYRAVRNLRLVALFVALGGGFLSFVTDTWREGALGLSVSLAVAIFGFGERMRGEDRAVGMSLVIVGIIGVIGHIIQILLPG